jgi:hypothetical protein
MLLCIESTGRCTHHKQVNVVCYYIEKESWQLQSQNHHVCHIVKWSVCDWSQIRETNGRTRTPGHTRCGIRCRWGLRIPAISPVPWSLMRSYPLSKSVCKAWSNNWYEKCQTTYGSMKNCNNKLDHCNSHRSCETLTWNKNVEIPITTICLLVSTQIKKLIICRAGPCISNQFRNIYPKWRW